MQLDDSMGQMIPGRLWHITIDRKELEEDIVVISKSNSHGEKRPLPTGAGVVQTTLLSPDNSKRGLGELEVLIRFAWNKGKRTNPTIPISESVLRNGRAFQPPARRQATDILHIVSHAALDGFRVQKALLIGMPTDVKGPSKIEELVKDPYSPLLHSDKGFIREH